MLTQQVTNVTIFRQGWVRWVGKSTMKSHSIVTHSLEKDSNLHSSKLNFMNPANRCKFHPEIAVLAVYVQMQVTLLTKPLPAESSVNHLGIDLFVCFFPSFPSNKRLSKHLFFINDFNFGDL